MTEPAPRAAAVRPDDRTSQLRPWHLAALAAALAVAAWLRWHLALNVPPWFAEVYIVRVAQRSFGEMINLAHTDIHPPLPFMLRWFWERLGTGIVWQKSLSILCALGSIVFAFDLARRAYGARAATLAAFLIAIHSASIQYSQEIEDYSLEWLLVTAMLWAAWAWNDRASRGGAIGYVIAATTALYSHYVSIMVWGVMVVAVAAVVQTDRVKRRTWFLLNLAVAACFAPQLPTLYEQFGRESYGRYWAFPTFHALAGVWNTLAFGSHWALLALLPLALIPLFVARLRRLAIVLWALLLLAPYATRVWVVLLPREVLFTAPLLMILVAGGITVLPWRPARFALGLLVLALGARGALHEPRFPEAVATGDAGKLVAGLARPGDLVVHTESHSLFYFSYACPQLRNRILRDPGDRLPFFEGGLAVPDSFYITPAEFRAARARGDRWFGVWVNRALATRGKVWRAGAAQAESLRVAAGDSVWFEAPVTVWEGRGSRRAAVETAPPRGAMKLVGKLAFASPHVDFYWFGHRLFSPIEISSDGVDVEANGVRVPKHPARDTSGSSARLATLHGNVPWVRARVAAGETWLQAVNEFGREASLQPRRAIVYYRAYQRAGMRDPEAAAVRRLDSTMFVPDQRIHVTETRFDCREGAPLLGGFPVRTLEVPRTAFSTPNPIPWDAPAAPTDRVDAEVAYWLELETSMTSHWENAVIAVISLGRECYYRDDRADQAREEIAAARAYAKKYGRFDASRPGPPTVVAPEALAQIANAE